MNDNSILKTVRVACGVGDDTGFDEELILHTNGVLMNVYQIGIGEAPFRITGYDETWDELITDPTFECLKDYVGLRVRMVFDPPASSALSDAIKRTIDELEWRINSQVDYH